MTRRIRDFVLTIVTLTQLALAQLQLPTHDGFGEKLHLPATLELAFEHQQTVIVMLVLLLFLTLGALIYCSVQVVRIRATFDRITEAVLRVDLLSQAFRSVSVEWDKGVLQQRINELEPQDTEVFDLGDEPLIGER